MQEGCDVPYKENVLNELHSGMNDDTVGHEFKVNDSTIRIK